MRIFNSFFKALQLRAPNMREWLWWPSVSAHALACIIAFVAVAFLGIAEIPRFPAFKEFTTVQASPSEFLLFSAVIAVANMCFLFLHARGDYLTTSSGLRPISGTFLLLSAALPLAWGGYRILFRSAPSPDLTLLASGLARFVTGTQLSDAAVLEWTRLFRALFIGESGLAMMLLFSGLWKAPPQETLDISGVWDRSNALVRRVFKCGPSLEAQEQERLKTLLTLLSDSAKKLDTRAFLKADLTHAGELAKNAEVIMRAIDIPFGALENLRTNASAEQRGAVSFLLGDH
jgi:hypothetical protein